jgi:biopolymer transport protein ExbD
MRFTPKQTRGPFSAIDLTPLVDVVFLLIIFFMATAQFVKMTQAELELPQQAGEEGRLEEKSELIINIDADNRFIVTGDVVSLDTLKRKVAYELAMAGANLRARDTRDSQLQIVIRADRRASSETLNTLVRMLSDLGVKTSAFGVEVP